MSTFFTSDWHLGHARIIELSGRPFGSTDEMNEAIIENYCNTVSDSDTVWFLGDMFMGKIAESLPLMRGLPGKKVLIPGNHDRVWVGNKLKEIKRFFPEYKSVFDQIFDGPIDMSVPEGIFVMSHFPPEGDSHGEDRYKNHRPPHYKKRWHVHGHVHEAWKVREADRFVNVGVDVWDFAPVSLETIRSVMAGSHPTVEA